MVNERAATVAIKKLGEFLIRYGLVLVLGWIGAMKFTAYEAAGIQGFCKQSADELDVQSFQPCKRSNESNRYHSPWAVGVLFLVRRRSQALHRSLGNG